MIEKKILIIGSFYHSKNSEHATSAAEQLTALFVKNNIGIVTATRQYKKLYKLVATIYVIISKCSRFNIAIVPLYGTRMSFIWQDVSVRLLKQLGKKVILIVHGGSIPKQVLAGEYKFIKAMGRADIIVCPSVFMQQFLERFGIKSLVIENSLDISAYPVLNKKIFRPHLLWMRSFSEVYNPEMAVRVALILSKKYPSFKMLMAGTDGGLQKKIEQMSGDYGLRDKIIFPGYLGHSAKMAYAEDYDIFLCTNRVDNAPVTLVEFMASGLVIVSVNSGGIPWMIKNGENGFLVNLDDDEAMAVAISRVIENPELGITSCINARMYAQQFNQESVFTKWQVVLNEL